MTEANRENAVEFSTGDGTCTCSFTSMRHVNRIKKLFEKYGSEFERFEINKDGSVYCRIPISWLRICRPTKKELSQEEKEILRERMKKLNANKG